MSQQVASHDEHSTDGGTAEMENVTALVPSRFVMCTLIRARAGESRQCARPRPVGSSVIKRDSGGMEHLPVRTTATGTAEHVL